MKCPHCNNELVVHIARGQKISGQWHVSRSHQFEQTTQPWQAPDGDYGGNVEMSRTQPARPASLESDVIVPLLQSLATGFVIGASSAPVAYFLQWHWTTPLIIGGATVTITWLSLLGAHRKLLWLIETVSKIGDEPAPPAPVTKPISLEVKHRDPAGKIGRFQYIDLPKNVTQEMFVEWSKSVLHGSKSVAQSSWCGNGKLFSKPVYSDFVAAMMDAGILALKGQDKSQGYRITNGGKHALRSLILAEE